MRPFDASSRSSSRGSMTVNNVQKVSLGRSTSTASGIASAVQKTPSSTSITSNSPSNSPSSGPRKPSKPSKPIKPTKPGSFSASSSSTSPTSSNSPSSLSSSLSSSTSSLKDPAKERVETNGTTSQQTPPSYRRSTNYGIPTGSGGMGFMAFMEAEAQKESPQEQRRSSDDSASKTGATGFMAMCNDLSSPEEKSTSTTTTNTDNVRPPPFTSKTRDKQPFSKVFSKTTRKPTIIAPSAPVIDPVDVYEEEPDIKYQMEGEVRKIKAATVGRLVKELTQDEVADPQLRDSFLITYRAFVTPVDLLDHLITRYEPSNMSKQAALTKRRVRVAGTVKAWLEQYFNDFFESTDLQKSLFEFLDAMSLTLPTSAEGIKKNFHKLMDKAQKEKEEKEEKEKEEVLKEEEDVDLWETAPVALKEEAEGFHTEGWLYLPEEELAQQMTKVETDIFVSILPKEYLAWNKKNRDVLAPNISRMIRHFNELSNWVRTQMVTIVRKDGRVKMLQKFIRLMEELMKLNNFNGMMEILSGINSSPVRRMKMTFEGLGKQYKKRFKVIEDLLTHNHSYRNYRKHLQSIIPPCIPYLGVCLTDLTFILDGNPDYVQDDLVHFFKWRKVSEIVVELKGYQTVKYPLVSSPGISLFLRTLPRKTYDEDKCYDWSTKVEPKNAKAHEKVLLKLIHKEEEMQEKLLKLKRKEEEMKEKLELLKAAPKLYVCLWEFVGEEGKGVKVGAGDLLSPINLITPEWGLFKTKLGEKVYVPRDFVRRIYPTKELVDEFLEKERKEKEEEEREEAERLKKEQEKEQKKKEKMERKKERERKRKEKEKRREERERKKASEQVSDPNVSPNLSSSQYSSPFHTSEPSPARTNGSPMTYPPSPHNSSRTPSPIDTSLALSTSRSSPPRPRSPSAPQDPSPSPPPSASPKRTLFGKEGRSNSTKLPKLSSKSSIVRMSSQKSVGGIKKGSGLKVGSGNRPSSLVSIEPVMKKKMSLSEQGSSPFSSSQNSGSFSARDSPHHHSGSLTARDGPPISHQNLIEQLQQQQHQQQQQQPGSPVVKSPSPVAPKRPERPERTKSPRPEDTTQPQPPTPQRQPAPSGMRLKLGKRATLSSSNSPHSSPQTSPHSPHSPHTSSPSPGSPKVSQASTATTPRGGRMTIISK